MSNKKKNIVIDKRSNYILNRNEIFTNLAKDYIKFIEQIDLTNIHSSIQKSQKLKKNISEL